MEADKMGGWGPLGRATESTLESAGPRARSEQGRIRQAVAVKTRQGSLLGRWSLLLTAQDHCVARHTHELVVMTPINQTEPHSGIHLSLLHTADSFL